MKITKSVVDTLQIPEKGQRQYSDSEVKGLCIIVTNSGRKTFYYQYGSKTERKRFKIGRYGDITLDQARAKAKMLAAKILIENTDPLEEKKNQSGGILTFGMWVNNYIEIVVNRKKPASVREDKRYLINGRTKNRDNNRGVNKRRKVEYVSPDWHKKPLKELTTGDIGRRFQLITKNISPTTANRWLASIRSCLQEAWRRELIEGNPAIRVRPNSVSNERDRVLNEEEFARFREAVEKLDDIYARTAFYLLTETGARLSEVLNAKWIDIKLEQKIWVLPNTKANKKQTIPLTPDSIQYLKKLPKKGIYIITGNDPDKPRSDLKRAWKKILLISGIEDLHIHDLRRTFCVQIIRIAGVNIASKLLRHSDIRITTKHYSPEDNESLLEVLEKRAKMLPFKR